MEYIWHITGMKKTGVTGAVLWLFAALFLFSLTLEPLAAKGATAEPAHGKKLSASRAAEVPPAPTQVMEIEYSVVVSEQVPNGRLVLDCTLEKAQSESTVHLLGDKIYKDYQGEQYSQVVINWFIKNRADSQTPWARTNMTKDGASFRQMN